MVKIWHFRRNCFGKNEWVHGLDVSWVEYEKLAVEFPGEGERWKATF